MTKKQAEAQADREYNPLELTELASTVESKLLKRPALPMEPFPMFGGAGIYAIFYSGSHPIYAPISGTLTPIYVGKAVPAGSRTGRTSAKIKLPIRDRLGEHKNSIAATSLTVTATSLLLADFSFRYLVTEETFIGLAERAMINSLKPVWNRVIDGFGNHGQGGGRGQQVRSRWDTLHPGREAPARLPESPLSIEDIAAEVAAHFVANPPIGSESDLPEVTHADVVEDNDVSEGVDDDADSES